MIIPLLTIIKSKVELYNLSMVPFYRQYQISRQGYFQAIKRQRLLDGSSLSTYIMRAQFISEDCVLTYSALGRFEQLEVRLNNLVN